MVTRLIVMRGVHRHRAPGSLATAEQSMLRARTFANSRSRCAPLVRGRGFNPRGRRRRRRASAPPANMDPLKWLLAARHVSVLDGGQHAPPMPLMRRAASLRRGQHCRGRLRTRLPRARARDASSIANWLTPTSALIAGNLGNKNSQWLAPRCHVAGAAGAAAAALHAIVHTLLMLLQAPVRAAATARAYLAAI